MFLFLCCRCLEYFVSIVFTLLVHTIHTSFVCQFRFVLRWKNLVSCYNFLISWRICCGNGLFPLACVLFQLIEACGSPVMMVLHLARAVIYGVIINCERPH